jgi:hypothetical protein
MIIMRISMLSGEVNEMDLDITPEQLESYELFGVLLQDAFPNLSPAEREFIKTGITPEEWYDTFGED